MLELHSLALNGNISELRKRILPHRLYGVSFQFSLLETPVLKCPMTLFGGCCFILIGLNILHEQHNTREVPAGSLHGITASCGCEHYKDHWFPEKPQKGSGYRCIRINHEMDPIISKVARRIGLNSHHLYELLPRELTMWVDPYEVSYRIGEDGSICVLYEAEAPASSSVSSACNNSALHCKNHFLMGRTSPPKNYLMTVSS